MAKNTHPNMALTDLIREIGHEVAISDMGIMMTKNEALARHLWDIVLNKGTTLANGAEIKVNSSEWADIAFKVIERMDGKAPLAIDHSVNPGISLTRISRFKEIAEPGAGPQADQAQSASAQSDSENIFNMTLASRPDALSGFKNMIDSLPDVYPSSNEHVAQILDTNEDLDE